MLFTRAASLEKISRFLARCSENMHIPVGSLDGGHALDLARGGTLVIRKSVVTLGHETEVPQSLNLAPFGMRCDGITRSNEKDASLHPFPDNWWCTGVPLADGRRFRIQDDTYMFWEVF